MCNIKFIMTDKNIRLNLAYVKLLLIHFWTPANEHQLWAYGVLEGGLQTDIQSSQKNVKDSTFPHAGQSFI